MSEQARGDRSDLSADELGLLENKILPTAVRWLRVPGLRAHALQTLNYWGEFDILRKDEEREKREREQRDIEKQRR